MDEYKPKNYFGLYKTILRLCGVSMYEDETALYRIYSAIVVFGSSIYPFLRIPDLFRCEFDVVVDIFIYEIAFFITFFKLMVVIINRKKLKEMFKKLEQKPFVPNPKRGGVIENGIINDFVSINNLQAKLYYYAATVYFSSTLTITIIKKLSSESPKDWPQIYGDFTLVNMTYSPNYEIVTTYQNFATFWFAICFMTVDLITAGVLCNISCQFKMLQATINRFVQKTWKVIHKDINVSLPVLINNNETSWLLLRVHLIEIIQYHLEIIHLAKEVEDVFNILLMLVFIGTLGMLASMIYATSSNPINSFGFVRKAMEPFFVVMQVFMFCYWGEQVSLESQKVGTEVYKIGFAFFEPTFQGSLKLIILRSQTPVKVTAGKFTDIGMTTFAWVLRASYSSFMLIRNTRQDQSGR